MTREELGAGAIREAGVVINLRSRRGIFAARTAPKELERRGVAVRQLHLVRNDRQLRKAVDRVIAAGLRTVVVGGGDGTVAAAADLLAGRAALTLGLLPVGTGNEVARQLGIPLSIAGACAAIARGRVTAVDVGSGNGRYFVHTALVGYPAHVNHSIPAWLKREFGKPAYIYSLLSAILRAKPFHVAVEAEGRSWEGETALLVVGNSRFHTPGRVLLPGLARADRGLLIYAPHEWGRCGLVRLAVALWIARQPRPSDFFAICADEATVLTEPTQELDVDGEYGGTSPVHFTIARSALRVIVP